MVLFFGILMGAMDIAILGPAMPAIRETFGLDDRLGSWIFSVWVLANLVSVPVMTKLADRYGRKTIYLLDIALFGIGSLIVSTAPVFGVLLVGRVLQGMAAAGIFPVAAAVVGAVIPPEKRGQAFGLLGSVFGIAFIVGPIVAGLMLNLGWRWLYLANVFVAALIFVLGWKILPKTAIPGKSRLDLIGLFSLGGALLSLAYALSVFDTADVTASLTSWRIISALALSAVLFPVFIAAERKAKDPVLRLDIFRNRQVALASVNAIGAGINEAAFIFFPTLIVMAYGVSTSQAAYMLLPMMFAVAIGSPIAGRLLDKVGSKMIVLVCNTLLVLGMFGVATSPASPAVFYLGSALIGLGMAGLLGSSLSYILIHEARSSELAISQGLITLNISIGQLLSAAAVGAIAASAQDPLSGYRNAFLAIVVLTIGVTAISFLLKNKEDEHEAMKEKEASGLS
ncbi:MAG: MFS transporter [Bacteroidetes bacterium]|nr:MFS transporter [Bacteroidota bacterium]